MQTEQLWINIPAKDSLLMINVYIWPIILLNTGDGHMNGMKQIVYPCSSRKIFLRYQLESHPVSTQLNVLKIQSYEPGTEDISKDIDAY